MLHYTTTFLAVFWSIVYLVCLVGTPLLGLVGGVLVRRQLPQTLVIA